MLFNKKISRSVYTDFVKCIAVGTAVILSAALIGAVIAGMTESPVSHISVIAFLSLILSAILGAVISTRLMSGQMKIPMLSALFITLVMMIIGLISNRGAIPRSAAMNYVCYLAVYTFASLLSRGKRAKRTKRFKHRS